MMSDKTRIDALCALTDGAVLVDELLEYQLPEELVANARRWISEVNRVYDLARAEGNSQVSGSKTPTTELERS